MTVGEKIRAARKAANWTQAELASTCDLATITIRQYENGTRTPNLKTLERISIELGIDPIELLPDEVTASWKSGKSFGASETWNEFYRYGYHVTKDEMLFVSLYWTLNSLGRKIAIERMKELNEIPRLQRELLLPLIDEDTPESLIRVLTEHPRYPKTPPQAEARDGENADDTPQEGD